MSHQWTVDDGVTTQYSCLGFMAFLAGNGQWVSKIQAFWLLPISLKIIRKQIMENLLTKKDTRKKMNPNESCE